MAKPKVQLEGWGRYPRCKGQVLAPTRTQDLVSLLETETPLIARGNGRSYGDSSFNADGAVSTLKLNRLLKFESETGTLTAEAGVMLADVIESFLPKGWFPPITPGTKFVTLGGMVASNVHGKNAVKDGAFGDHVDQITILRADGQVVACSREEQSELFFNTIGGMGLTGIILTVSFRLKRVETGWISQTRTAHENLASVMAQFDATESATYRVAWIDVLARGNELGRSILDVAEHAPRDALQAKQSAEPFGVKKPRALAVPFAPPFSPLNKWTVKAFNALHYRRGRASAGETLVDWNSYFYPLDSLLHWNRIYGRSGFAQYQCVIPMDTAYDGLVEILDAISSSGRGSFLAVLKRLGETCGSLSFPMNGYTLALDFPWSAKTAQLLDKLDDITVAHKGRVYLTKDSRLSAPSFRAMQNEADVFHDTRAKDGTLQKFQSLQSLRLNL